MSEAMSPDQPAGYPPASGDGQLGAIEIKTSFMPLAFLLYLFPAKAVIDGGSELNQGWGVRVYPIPAGRHSVRAWCPYFFLFKMGDTTQVVDVVPGQVTAIHWKCPWLVFLAGTWAYLGSRALTQSDVQGGRPALATPQAPVAIAAASAVPAGWHPDPQGQAALRYWDGQQWTEHTSDGQPAADASGAPG